MHQRKAQVIKDNAMLVENGKEFQQVKWLRYTKTDGKQKQNRRL